ncbi:hypothetical protein [Coleofasciculus sp. H7-2]
MRGVLGNAIHYLTLHLTRDRGIRDDSAVSPSIRTTRQLRTQLS